MSRSNLSTDDGGLADSYTPCNSLSLFHDLKCGHRVKVQHAWETCGTNCKNPMVGKPFVCSACLVHDVRLEVMFGSLDVDTTGEDVAMENADGSTSRKNKIQEIANFELQKLLAQGRRGCIKAPKLNDPVLQFFDQFLKEDGFAGINEEPHATPAVRYRRPRQRVQKDTFTEEDFKDEWERQERLEKAPSCQDQSGQGKPSTESNAEDEVVDAVRNALSSCTLAGNFA